MHHDPPTDADLAAATDAANEAFRSLRLVTATELLLAGGTASALGHLQGTGTLDDAALDAALRALQSAPAATLAPRIGLEVARVGLMAAGAIIVRALDPHLRPDCRDRRPWRHPRGDAARRHARRVRLYLLTPRLNFGA